MKILAIDTTTQAYSVALCVEEVIYRRYEIAPQLHAQRLLTLIDEIFFEAGCELAALDGLALTNGPGSFTGVRIAVSCVQAMAFAQDIPIFVCSSLQVLAQQGIRKYQAEFILPAIDARKGELYWGRYQNQNGLAMALKKDRLSSCDLVKADPKKIWSLIGYGWQLAVPRLSFKTLNHEGNDHVFPDAVDLISLAKPNFKQGNILSAEQLKPLYLRNKIT